MPDYSHHDHIHIAREDDRVSRGQHHTVRSFQQLQRCMESSYQHYCEPADRLGRCRCTHAAIRVSNAESVLSKFAFKEKYVRTDLDILHYTRRLASKLENPHSYQNRKGVLSTTLSN